MYRQWWRWNKWHQIKQRQPLLITKQLNSLAAVSCLSSESVFDGERQFADYLSVELDLVILQACCRRWWWPPANEKLKIIVTSTRYLFDYESANLYRCRSSNSHLNWVHCWVVQNVKCQKQRYQHDREKQGRQFRSWNTNDYKTIRFRPGWHYRGFGQPSVRTEKGVSKVWMKGWHLKWSCFYRIIAS